jgi:hypothetical protein
VTTVDVWVAAARFDVNGFFGSINQPLRPTTSPAALK